MCTNTLQKDCGNEDPLVRGLALRALCSLRLPQMVEYISEPLRKGLQDAHAYVRKTAVMGILKLFYLDHTAFDNSKFVDILYDMLNDPDASVVANCIWVLQEIMIKSPNGGMAINRPIMFMLLNRIHEFSEFGILTILGLVPRYHPLNEEEAFQIMNLLDPVLKTSNAAAALATIRAFLALIQVLSNKTVLQTQVVTRVKAPIVTLVAGGSPELVYCLLKHVQALITLAPGVFDDEYRQFYVRYNELNHIKYLKVQILSKLANDQNSQQIINELAEYICNVDVVLSRLSVRGMAQIAFSKKEKEEGIVLRLVEMLDLDVGHVPSEAATALADVVRKHASLQDIVAHRLPRALRYISEPTGRASVIWLLGETGSQVKEAPYALEKLVDEYHLIQCPKVKMALLTAMFKLFFDRPPECQHMLGRLLKKAVEDVSNQDLHDRALLYWRLLSKDVRLASQIFVTHKSTTSKFMEEDDFGLDLLQEFNTLSTIYGKTSQNFIAEEYQPIQPTPQPMLPPTLSDVPPEENHVVVEPVSPKPQQIAATELVADLLDFGEPIANEPVEPLASPLDAPLDTQLVLIPSVTMTGDTYQSIWGAHPNAADTLIKINNLPSMSEIEQLLKSRHIFTMASGELTTELKFFLYCQDEQTCTYLLQALFEKGASQKLHLEVRTTDSEQRNVPKLVDIIQHLFSL